MEQNKTKTIGQILGITEFPYIVENKTGTERIVYTEYPDNSWFLKKYDKNNNEIYVENSDGKWKKYEFDINNNFIHYENSYGFWTKYKFDDKNNLIYCENSTEYCE